jgi:hypothetical protein
LKIVIKQAKCDNKAFKWKYFQVNIYLLKAIFSDDFESKEKYLLKCLEISENIVGQ